MTWIAEDIALSLYRRFGTFFAWEWRECGQKLGLRFVDAELTIGVPAILVGRTIVLRAGMSAYETAWYAWHEIAHFLLHPHNLLAPTGLYDQAKRERQANEFTAIYPIWDAPDVTFDARPPRSVSWDTHSERRYLNCPWGGGV